MGIIQNSINQLIGSSALLSQLPSGQALAERQKWKGDWKKLESTEERLGLTAKNAEGHHEVQPVNSPEQAKLAERAMDYRQQFLNQATAQGGRNISPEALTSQQHNMEKIEGYRGALNTFGERQVSMEQANAHSDQIAQRQATQKRNFMDYLRDTDSSLGRIGDLPDHLQKQIAAQYTPGMRKKLMNSMDKERANK